MITWLKKYDRINPYRTYTTGQAVARWVGEDTSEYNQGAIETLDNKLGRVIEVVAKMVDALPEDMQTAIMTDIVEGFKEATT
jgi:predicted metal-dependent phosphoesterase TrpH